MSEQDKIKITVASDLEDRVVKFLKNQAKYVAEMRTEVERGDYPSVKMTGGMIKKAAATLGLATFKEFGESIENAANLKDSGKVKSQIEELAVYLSRVEIVYS
ncbi:MAG: hypothetical protein L7F77_08985 [Candidatus Magnetominusculus sp. LBB02]|nr:hypothetical protein [Candidatus Magnetominusculus sp. LBB02]